jgi:acyl carrier protein
MRDRSQPRDRSVIISNHESNRVRPDASRGDRGEIGVNGLRRGSAFPATDASTMQTNMQHAATSNSDQNQSSNTALERELAGLIVEALNLEVQPDEITADAPLYGEGLGLDSIDILEVALVVSKKYGFQLRSDDENNVKIFHSLGSLAGHIAAHRTK